MDAGLDSLVGVLPVMLVGGLAMKMADSLPSPQNSWRRSPRRRSPRRTIPRQRRPRQQGRPSFGNFSNVGM